MQKIKVKSKSRDAAARPKMPKLKLDSVKTTAAHSKLQSTQKNSRTGMAFLESSNFLRQQKRSPRSNILNNQDLDIINNNKWAIKPSNMFPRFSKTEDKSNETTSQDKGCPVEKRRLSEPPTIKKMGQELQPRFYF
jgi:hypothetical protein